MLGVLGVFDFAALTSSIQIERFPFSSREHREQ